MGQSFAVGVDLGGTNLKAAIVNERAEVRAQRTIPTDAHRGPEPVMTDIAALVNDLLKSTDVPRERIVGVGIGSPGPLSAKHGIIYHCANLPGWDHVPLRQKLSDALSMRVVLDNDANAAAYGEYWHRRIHAGSGNTPHPTGDLVLLTLGTGVGGGVVLGGKVLHGHFENAAELGHLIVVPQGLRCPCGQSGCLEQYSSASAIERRVTAAVRAGSQSSIESQVKSGESIDARHVAEHARAGDPLCRRIWDEACAYLAMACINIQHAFNPAYIVLSGGLVQAGDFLLSNVKRHFEQERWSLCRDFPAIMLSELGQDAGVIGAAGLVLTSSEPEVPAPG